VMRSFSSVCVYCANLCNIRASNSIRYVRSYIHQRLALTVCEVAGVGGAVIRA
jgi:hypothetical protein